MLESLGSIRIRLCIDCVHCKTIRGVYYCKFEHFYKSNFNDIVLYTPEDFNCVDWDGDD